MNHRIGIVTPEFPPLAGGVGQSVQRLATSLTKAGCVVKVIVLPTYNTSQNGQTPYYEALQAGQLEIYRLNPPHKRDKYFEPGLDTACFEWLGEFCQSQRLDLLHSFYISHTGFTTGLVAHELGLPFIASVRGNDLHQNLFDSRRFHYIKWTLENADLLTFVSADLERRAHKLVHLKAPTRVIWNGIDPTEFNPAAEIPAKFSGLTAPVIGSAGYFRHKKGIETLLAACELLEQPISVLLVGDFLASEADYWTESVLPAVAPQVAVTVSGIIPHPEILPYYKLLDIVVLPSVHEGCPNVMLEAMLMGRPLVCTPRGAMGDILEQSQAGVLVPPNNPRQLAAALQMLLADQELRQTLGQRGQAFAQRELSAETETATWLECYRRLQN